jgi:UDP:flavonoid glycosyltransferase YjiC (YdhE family)
MRFLLTIWPLVGHVHPFMSVAKALQARGHEVAFYTGASLRPSIAREGFVVFPFGEVDEAHVLNLIETVETGGQAGPKARRHRLRAFREWLVETIPGQVADLQPIIHTWRPDVLVSETATWGPILVLWESEQIPVAISSTLMGALIPGPDAPVIGLGLPPPRGVGGRLRARAVTLGTDLLAGGLRRRIDQIRAAYGLGPLGCSVNAFTGRLPLYLVPTIPELDYNRRDLPASVHYVGPCVWNKPSQEAAPPWLEEIPRDRPWVHVTEGTAHYQAPFLLRAAAAGLAHQPYEAILTTGPQRDPTGLDLGPRAPNVRVERWVSHSDLLPRCAAMVTTGGAGSVMAGLQAGVPLVVVPTLWDKADNAQRVVEAGAGLRLEPRACTPEGLRRAVAQVLEPRYRARAQWLAERLRDAPGPPRVAQLLESLAISGSRVAHSCVG